MPGLDPDNIHAANVWLNVIAYKNSGYHKGESFLLLTKEDLLQDEKLARRKPDYEDDNFVIFRYPSTEIVFDEVLWDE
jgi:hypothetical protein